MREYTLSYDASLKKFAFIYKCNLVKKYQGVLKNLIEEDSGMTDYSLEFLGNNVIRVILPFEMDPSDVQSRSKKASGNSLSGGNLVSMSLDDEDAEELKNSMEKVQKMIWNFENSAMREETKNIEFIPLSGYPAENIKDDVRCAFENKRDFCVIDTMDSYKDFENTTTLNQAFYKFGTDEYNNILLAGLKGDMDELRKITDGWLKRKEYL